MKKFLKVLIVLAVILAASAVLAPLVYRIIPSVKIERIFHRIVTVFVIGLAFVFLRKKKVDWRKYGFDFSVSWLRLVFFGFVGGFGAILILNLLEIFWGPRSIQPEISWSVVAFKFLEGFIGASLVGIAEEFFFRGFIFTKLNEQMHVIMAVITAGFIYSIVHFLDAGNVFISQTPTIAEGFKLMIGHLEPLFNRPLAILPQFLGLFLFGIVLNIAFLRTKTLFLSIGLHAGTVFFIRAGKPFFNKGPETYLPFWGNMPIYDGLIEWVVIALLIPYIYWISRSQRIEAVKNAG